MTSVLLSGLEIGVLYAPLALGVYILMGVMSLPDLTVQGAFGIGGAVAIVAMVNGLQPVLCVCAAIIAGALTGLITAYLHNWLHLSVLIAGIIMTTAALSISLMIMRQGNVVYSGTQSVFSWLQALGVPQEYSTIAVGLALSIALIFILWWFMKTEYGLSMRATGENIQTARGMGIRTERRQVTGFMIGNGLSALSGSLVVQQQGFMDVTIQNGILVVGLAAVMIGLSVTRSTRTWISLSGVVIGILIYQTIVSAALRIGLNPNALQALEGALIVAVIGIRLYSEQISASVWKRKGGRVRGRQHQFYENDKVAHFI